MRKFTEAEISEMADKVVAELERRERERQVFTTLHQDLYMERLGELIKQQGFLDLDDLWAGIHPELDPTQFNYLFENVTDTAEALNKIGKEAENPFPNQVCYVTYNDMNIIFFVMWGQGTCIQIYEKPEDWKPELAISFADVKQTATPRS